MSDADIAPAGDTGDALDLPLMATPGTVALALILSDKRSPLTRSAYARDLTQFFRFALPEQPEPLCPLAVEWLCRHDAPALALLLVRYRNHLRGRGMSGSTINRQMSTIRSLLQTARRLGANCPDPTGLLEAERVKQFRETAGPGLEAMRQIVSAPDTETLTGKRDFAIFLLLCENGLRRMEIASCDVIDVDLEEERLWIQGKGRREREAVSLSPTTAAAIESYLEARSARGETILLTSPLWLNEKGGRLTDRGVSHISLTVSKRVLGKAVGPHGWRHSTITAYLDASGGDIRGAQQLARHADIRTTAIYDDNRHKLQGAATKKLSALLHGDKKKIASIDGKKGAEING